MILFGDHLLQTRCQEAQEREAEAARQAEREAEQAAAQAAAEAAAQAAAQAALAEREERWEPWNVSCVDIWLQEIQFEMGLKRRNHEPRLRGL